MIKVIFFDAAGTLIHLPKGVGYHYREVALRHGWDIAKEQWQNSFAAARRSMPERVATGVPRPNDDKDWWRELVMQVLDRCAVGAEEARRAAYFEELYAEFMRPGAWTLFPEVRAVLEALASQPALGVISNFDGRLRPILADLRLAAHFRHVVISSEVGADKPAPQIFAQALALAEAAPREAVHVGDDALRDWAGAQSAGLHVFRLDRPRNSLRGLPAFLASLER